MESLGVLQVLWFKLWSTLGHQDANQRNSAFKGGGAHSPNCPGVLLSISFKVSVNILPGLIPLNLSHIPGDLPTFPCKSSLRSSSRGSQRALDLPKYILVFINCNVFFSFSFCLVDIERFSDRYREKQTEGLEWQPGNIFSIVLNMSANQ